MAARVRTSDDRRSQLLSRTSNCSRASPRGRSSCWARASRCLTLSKCDARLILSESLNEPPVLQNAMPRAFCMGGRKFHGRSELAKWRKFAIGDGEAVALRHCGTKEHTMSADELLNVVDAA